MHLARPLRCHEQVKPELPAFSAILIAWPVRRLPEVVRRFLGRDVVRLVGHYQDGSAPVTVSPEMTEHGHRDYGLLRQGGEVGADDQAPPVLFQHIDQGGFVGPELQRLHPATPRFSMRSPSWRSSAENRRATTSFTSESE